MYTTIGQDYIDTLLIFIKNKWLNDKDLFHIEKLQMLRSSCEKHISMSYLFKHVLCFRPKMTVLDASDRFDMKTPLA